MKVGEVGGITPVDIKTYIPTHIKTSKTIKRRKCQELKSGVLASMPQAEALKGFTAALASSNSCHLPKKYQALGSHWSQNEGWVEQSQTYPVSCRRAARAHLQTYQAENQLYIVELRIILRLLVCSNIAVET